MKGVKENPKNSGHTQSYKDNIKKVKVLKNLKLEEMNEDQIVNRLYELCEIFKLVKKKGTSLRKNNSGSREGRSGTSSTRFTDESARTNTKVTNLKPDIRANYQASFCVNNTIWGSNIMSKDDFESLLNAAVFSGIQRYRKDLRAQELIKNIQNLYEKNNWNCKIQVLKNDPIKQEGFRGALEGDSNEDNVVDLLEHIDKKEINDLLEELRLLNIKQVKDYKVLNELYGYTCSYFKSKIINESVAIEFRREMNNRRGKIEKDDIVKHDLECRKDFLEKTLDDNLEKNTRNVSQVDIQHQVFQIIQDKVSGGANTNEILEDLVGLIDQMGQHTGIPNKEEAIIALQKYIQETFPMEDEKILPFSKAA